LSKIDTYGSLYREHSNPYISYERFYSVDVVGCPLNQFKITAELQSSTAYILIIAANILNQTENVSILTFGPNSLTFNRISKSKIELFFLFQLKCSL